MRAEEKKRDSEIRRNARKFWVRPIFTIERRVAQGASNNLVQEMIFEDREKFFNYFRITPETFEKLLQIISPHIQKQFVIREPISARSPISIRLQICLRLHTAYLTSGDSMVSISYAFRSTQYSVKDNIRDLRCNMGYIKRKNIPEIN